MISKSELKLVQSLRLKKFRQKYDLFVAEGEKTVRTLLAHQRFQLRQLFAISPWDDQSSIGVNTSSQRICTKEELKKLSNLQSTPTVLAIFEIPIDTKGEQKKYSREIYLDDIQDPGNVGAIIRIADWFGVERVVRSEGSADFYNAKVVQATMGSIANVDLVTVAKSQFSSCFAEHYKIGACMSTDDSYEPSKKKVCLVIGNEGKGISSEILAHLDCQLHIEGAPSRAADSLNASVAAGILAQKVFGKS